MKPGIGFFTGQGMVTAEDWQSRVIANGGTAPAEVVQAVGNWLAGVVAAGLRSKIARANFFAGDSLASALVPVIRDAGDALDATAIPPENHSAQGITGDGGNLLLTGATPAACGMTTEQCHAAVWVGGEDANANLGPVLGSVDGPGNSCRIALSTGACFDCWQVNDFGNEGSVPMGSFPMTPPGAGGYLGSRVAAGSAFVLKDGAQIGSITTLAGAMSSSGFGVFGQTGVTYAGCLRLVKGYTLGPGLTVAEAQTLHALTATLLAALGR